MSHPTIESRLLLMKLRENEDNYTSGRLDLRETLDETDRLYNEIKGNSGADGVTANEIMTDSDLMKLQTRIAKRSAKNYKPDSLVFNPVEFANKVKMFYGQPSTSQNVTQSFDDSIRSDDFLWLQLGNVARKLLHSAPPFTFMHGTFDADPVEVVKKKRKMKEKDKLGKATKPKSMSMTQNKDKRDTMIEEAERIYGILTRLLEKVEDNVVCFYEFVTDPNSFGHTVENVFLISLLVKEGYVRIIKDTSDLPCLSLVSENERRERNPSDVNQAIMSISYKEWQDIVKTFKLEKSIIPPRKKGSQK